MKKSVIATAIAAAATISTGAHAVVSSLIPFPAGPLPTTGIELTISGFPSEVDCAGLPSSGFVTQLAFSGTGIYALNWTGQVCLDVGAGAPYVALVFSLRGTALTPLTDGTIFDQGQIDVYVDFGTGWNYATTVVAALSAGGTPIVCTPIPGVAAGLIWTGSVPSMLPGFGAGDAVCNLTLLGLPSSIYLDGKKFE